LEDEGSLYTASQDWSGCDGYPSSTLDPIDTFSNL
jgi:hypothetical protein